MTNRTTEAVLRDLIDPLKVGEQVRVVRWNTVGRIVELKERHGRRFARVQLTGFYTDEFLIETLDRWPYGE